MPYCSSCGSPIPEGQGSSCSMCYGDIDHGTDGYYRQYVEQQQEEWERLEYEKKQAQQEEQPISEQKEWTDE